jgi:serine-type D-Ala-D-Ala carboxypeptidase (penicillin-binding protein 5/6)
VKGQQAAILKIAVGDQAVLDVPLLALEGVAQAGLLGRAWDALRLWIK